MKYTLTILALITTIVVVGQSNRPAPNRNTEEIINPNYKNFKELNVKKIPTGVLLDYGYSQIDVKKFNGKLRNDTYTSSKSLKAIYYTLLSAVMDKKQN